MNDYYGDELDDMIMSAMSLASNVYEKSNLKQSMSVSLADIIHLPFDPTEGTDLPDTKGGMYNTVKFLFRKNTFHTLYLMI